MGFTSHILCRRIILPAHLLGTSVPERWTSAPVPCKLARREFQPFFSLPFAFLSWLLQRLHPGNPVSFLVPEPQDCPVISVSLLFRSSQREKRPLTSVSVSALQRSVSLLLPRLRSMASLAPPVPVAYLHDDIEASLAERRQTVSQASRELDIEEEDEDKVPAGYEADRDGKFAPEKLAEGWEGKWGIIGTVMAFLIRNGCEARGIQPVRVEVSRASELEFCPSLRRFLIGS